MRMRTDIKLYGENHVFASFSCHDGCGSRGGTLCVFNNNTLLTKRFPGSCLFMGIRRDSLRSTHQEPERMTHWIGLSVAIIHFKGENTKAIIKYDDNLRSMKGINS